MAQLGLTHNFMWSRWNSQLNSRSIALLVREIIEKRKTVGLTAIIELVLALKGAINCPFSFAAKLLDIVRDPIEGIHNRVHRSFAEFQSNRPVRYEGIARIFACSVCLTNAFFSQQILPCSTTFSPICII